MASIGGRVSGDKKLRRRIRTIQDGLPPLVSKDRLGSFLLRRMQDRFSRRVDPDNNPWVGRSPKTKGNHPLLEKTGRMRKAMGVLSGTSGMGINTGAGFRIGVRSLEVPEGNRMVNTATYGRVHQIGNSHVPKRRFLGINRLDVKAVDSLLRRELDKLIRA